jgi:prepilin-type N-terminal cleavage/methylation domain-containing protein
VTAAGGVGAIGRDGFTLLELLVTVAVLGVLAALLLPSLNRARSRAVGLFCMNNLRQLTLGWTLYAADNADRLVYNLGGDLNRPLDPRVRGLNWVNNFMNWELDPDNTNETFAALSPLGSYLAANSQVFRCPADRALSPIQRQAGWVSRVRSVSLNAMVGDAGINVENGLNRLNPGYRQFLRLSDFPASDSFFVFLDEHPDSIGDGYFLNKSEEFEWLHLPASHHQGAGAFSFADGHLEMHKWQLSQTRPPARPDAAALPQPVRPGKRADFQWVVDRTSFDQDDAHD